MAKAGQFGLGGEKAKDGGGGNGLDFPMTTARQWTLENGLELIVQEDGASPLASVQAWCRTGSIYEGKWLGGGMSHLLEHMLFKGTERRGSAEIAQGVQDVGGYFNAYTSFERTVYWIDVPAEGVETALDILCDMTTSSTLPAEELMKEQDVIRREIEMGRDDPEQCLSRLMFSTAFAVHPYRQPVIGHLEIFNRVTREDLVEFYGKHYVPNNLFFVVTGNVDAEAVRERVRMNFEKEERGTLEAALVSAEPRQLGRREAHEEFATQLSRTSLAWHIPGVTHADVPALDVLSTVLGSGRSSRLNAALREREKLVHGVHAYAYTPGHGGLFVVGTVTDPQKREAAEERVLTMVEEIAREGIEGDELEKARKMVLSDQLHGLTTTRGQASDLGSSWLMARNLDFTAEYLEALRRVTPEEVRLVARNYLRGDNLTAVSLNPKGSTKARAKVAARHRGVAIEKHILENGLTLLVREDARLPLVNVEAMFRGGLLAESEAASGAARLMAQTLIKGTAKSSGEELAQRAESVGGNLGTGSGRNSFGISLDVLGPDMGLAFDLLAEVCLAPTFPGEEMEKEREAQRAAIKAAEDQPMSVASRLLRQRIFGAHPYARDLLGTSESLDRIGRGDLVSLHEELVVGRNGVVAVFGDVEGARVKAELEERFAELREGVRAFAEKGKAERGEIAESEEVTESMDKAQAIVLVGYPACNIFHEDRHALELVDEACSDLSSRLFLRIREEMGLAYMVGSNFTYGFDPGGFVMYAGTAPEKAGEVHAALLEEVEKLASEGLTEAELERAKRTYLGKLMMRRQSNAGLADAAGLEELYGLGFGYGEEQVAIVKGLGLGEVNGVIGSYFRDRPRVEVTVSNPGSSD